MAENAPKPDLSYPVHGFYQFFIFSDEAVGNKVTDNCNGREDKSVAIISGTLLVPFYLALTGKPNTGQQGACQQ